MIKTIIFDIDGTLYDYKKAHAKGLSALDVYAKEKLGIEAEEFHRCYDEIYYSTIDEYGYHNADIHNRLIRFMRMLETWGKPVLPYAAELYDTYWDAMTDASEAFEGMEEVLIEAKKRGMRLGIGTDMTGYMQLRKLRKLGFDKYFDFIVTSEEACVEKPHPDFFRLCVKKAGVLPEECLFVGDNLKKDIGGALRAGMHALWYAGQAEPSLIEEEQQKKPAYEMIRDYGEFFDLKDFS